MQLNIQNTTKKYHKIPTNKNKHALKRKLCRCIRLLQDEDDVSERICV